MRWDNAILTIKARIGKKKMGTYDFYATNPIFAPAHWDNKGNLITGRLISLSIASWRLRYQYISGGADW